MKGKDLINVEIHDITEKGINFEKTDTFYF